MSTRPNWTRFSKYPEGQPDPFEPKNWAQNWVEPKKNGSGLAVPDLV